MFPEISLNPASAKDIKQWILQLAVEGKLTKKWREQNPKTESASKLVEKMSLELKQLIKNKQVKKEKELEPINETQTEIPDSWTQVRLGNIGDWGAGATPLRSVSAYYDGDINWYKSGELNNGIIDYPSEEKITEEALKKCSLRMNKPGDVLIAMYGATIGKTGLLQTYGTTNQAVCGCTPYSGITSSYLILLLNGYKTVFIDQGEGGAQPNISRVKIRNQIVKLPPLEEQHAIVSIVESLFKEVDELAAQAKQRIELKRSYASVALKQLCEADTAAEWQQILSVFPEIFNDKAIIKTLRETILQLAVQGKLSAKWRLSSLEGGLKEGDQKNIMGGEISSLEGFAAAKKEGDPRNHQTAHELLTQIKAEKAQLIKEKKIKAEKPLPPIEADEIPFELPEGWVWCRLGEVTQKLGAGSTPLGGDKAYISSGIKFFRSQNIHNQGLRLENVAFIDSITHEKMKGTKVLPKDILLNITGGSIGRSTLIPDDFDTANVSQHVSIVRLVEFEIRRFIHLLITSPIFQSEIMKVQVGVSREGLSMTKLKLFVIPLPPISEQQIIVEKVNALMGLCDELEKEVEGRDGILSQLSQG